jgi:hypothetical protein
MSCICEGMGQRDTHDGDAFMKCHHIASDAVQISSYGEMEYFDAFTACFRSSIEPCTI